MSILRRYIISKVSVATLQVMAVVLALEIFLLFMAELPTIGLENYTLFSALIYVILNVPNDLYQVFPMIMLLGSLIAMSQLSLYNEWIVIRMSGHSMRWLLMSIILAVGLWFTGAFLIGEGIGPSSQAWAISMKHNLQKAMTKGRWLRAGQSFVHVRTIGQDQRLYGITRFVLDPHLGLKEVSRAHEAELEPPRWKVYQVDTTFLEKKGAKTVNTPVAYWPIPFKPERMVGYSNDFNTKPLMGLWKYANALKSNNLNADRYWLSFWQRLFKPLATFIMIALAIPFVCGSSRHISMGRRMMVGIVLASLFYLTDAMLSPLSLLYQVPPWLAALLPSMLVIHFCFLFLLAFYFKRRIVRLNKGKVLSKQNRGSEHDNISGKTCKGT